MGSIPIAGVIWQHIHYIVGLQRLGPTFTMSRIPPGFPTTRKPSIRATTLPTRPRFWRSWLTNSVSNAAGLFAPATWGNPRRFAPNENPTTLLEADAILNVAARRSSTTISARATPSSTSRAIREWSRSRSTTHPLDDRVSRPAPGPFTFAKHRDRSVPGAAAQVEVVADPPAGRDRSWKTIRRPTATAVFTSIATVTRGLKDIEWRGGKYSGASRANSSALSPRQRSRRALRAGDRDQGRKNAPEFLQNGWRFRGTHEMSVDYWQYRDYIRRSKGDSQSRKTNTSGCTPAVQRSQRLLPAAGGRSLPTNRLHRSYGNSGGLFAFRSLGEIAERCGRLTPTIRSTAAPRAAIACETFEAEKVVGDLLLRAGV